MHRIAFSVALAWLVCVGGPLCTALPAGEPLTLTTVEQENELGDKAYREILSKEKVCADKPLNQMVDRVIKRIAAAAPDKGFRYEFAVLESTQVNAFCLPGGKVCVFTGLLPYCHNEAGLAAVIGHEVAHAVLRHAGQRMTQGTLVDLIGAGIGKVLEIKGVGGTTQTIAMGAYQYGTQLGVLLPYSRKHEVEADEEGLLYMARAGYDPQEALLFWQRFSELKSDLPGFLSTHPSHGDRIQRIEKIMNKAQQLYAQAPVRSGAGEGISAAYLHPPAAVAGSAPKPAAPATSPGTAAPGTAQTTSGAPAGQPRTTAGVSLPNIALGDLARGLQEALSNGFKWAIGVLGRQDGFFRDELVKIVMPEKLAKFEQFLRLAGKGDLVDDFVLQMNRAAEQAVPATADILAQAVASLTFADAQAILNGPPNAATQYFQRTCHASLRDKILPIVKSATAKSGATGAYKNMTKKAGFVGRVLLGDFDLDSYVTEKGLAGLYVKMAEEEKRIRDNPAGQASGLLRRVFGGLTSR
jgi:Zn-dependent protease with chaperone function